MAEFAKLVVIRREGLEAKLIVDGAEFPWLISAVATIDCNSGEMPSVQITLFADRVEMINDLTPRGPDA